MDRNDFDFSETSFKYLMQKGINKAIMNSKKCFCKKTYKLTNMSTMSFNKTTNLADILTKLDEYKNQVVLFPKFVFRGQADYRWKLEPSLTRIAQKRNLSREKVLQLERETLNIFTRSAKNFVPPHIALTYSQGGSYDLSAWLTIMQHYSSPTRLLDWTSSPLVALYFCCSDESIDGSLYVADFHIISENADRLFPPIIDNNIEIKPAQLFFRSLDQVNSVNAVTFMTVGSTNERIEAQQGLFSICTNPLTEHEQIMTETGALKKIIIPKEIKTQVMKDLYNMNVNAKTLFPGIDGLGRSLNEFCNLWSEESILK